MYKYQKKRKMRLFVVLSVLLLCGWTSESCYQQDETSAEQTVFTSEEEKHFEEVKLALIRDKILNGLGMMKPPKIDEGHVGLLKNNIQKLPAMMKKNRFGDNRTEQKKPTKVVVFAQYGNFNPCLSPDWIKSDNHSSMTFNLPEAPANIKDAILWYKSVDGEENVQQMEISMCSCVKTKPTKQFGANRRSTAVDCVKTVHERKWDEAKKGWSNIRLEKNWKSKFENGDRQILLVINGKLRMTDNKRPFLSMEIHDRDRKRSRRNRREVTKKHGDCPVNNNNTGNHTARQTCCRTNFRVDVAQLGFSSWIISPPAFNFYYCSGFCDNGFDRLSDDGPLGLDHSVILNAYIKQMNLNLIPCCVTKRMTHLPVTITTDGHTANRTFIPNFLVDECACIGFA